MAEETNSCAREGSGTERKIMAEMKGQKKKRYKYEDIEIEIVTTQEKLKVTIARDSDDESEG